MKVMEKAVYLILLVFCCTAASCTGDEVEPEMGQTCPVEAVEGPADDIVGKWKMVWMRRGFSIETVDHSCNNIIYHFRPDGILEVNSDVEEAGGYAFGEYDYELILDPYNMGATSGVKIGDFLRWACFIEITTMILDIRPLDG